MQGTPALASLVRKIGIKSIKPRKFGYDITVPTSFIRTDSWGEGRVSQCHLRLTGELN